MENNSQPCIIAIIAAIGVSIKNPILHGIYSGDGGLPWPKLTKDFDFFKNKTINHVVVMGKGTWESLPEKVKPLPNRLNIIVSKSIPEGKHIQDNDEEKPFFVCKSIEQAIEYAKIEKPRASIFFIGGEQIWQEAIHYCTNLYITHVRGDFEEKFYTVKIFPYLLDPEIYFPKMDFCLATAINTIDQNYKLSFKEYRRGFPVYDPNFFIGN